MNYLSIFYNICLCLGGITLFMYAMKLLGEGLESLAGSKIKSWLGKATSNSLMGVAVGTGVTALVHSSTAISVMMVGFVNVGLMTLRQAASVIMGANIGTTITLQIISMQDYFNISAIMSLGAAIGLCLMLFSKKSKIKQIGVILIALGMLFIGLDFMESTLGEFKKLEGFSHIFDTLTNPVLLVAAGFAFTAVIQSSTASTIILTGLIASGGGGGMTILSAFYAILGMNIGTCLTAVLSSIGANVAARRTAFIHLFFNVIGCVLVFIPLLLWGEQIVRFFEIISGATEYTRQIANFHTIYNVLSTVVLLPFIGLQVKLAETIIKDKGVRVKKSEQLSFIDDRILETPSFALSQAVQEIQGMGELAMKNLEQAVDGFIKGETGAADEIKEREIRINFLTRAITEYLVKISSSEISFEDEKRIGTLYHVVSDLERVGDHADNVINYAIKVEQKSIILSQEALSEIAEMFKLVKSHYGYCMKAFVNRNLGLLGTIEVLEDKVDESKAVLADAHIRRLNNGTCSAEAGALFLSIIGNFERVSDHMTNVAYSIRDYTKVKNATVKKIGAV